MGDITVFVVGFFAAASLLVLLVYHKVYPPHITVFVVGVATASLLVLLVYHTVYLFY